MKTKNTGLIVYHLAMLAFTITLLYIGFFLASPAQAQLRSLPTTSSSSSNNSNVCVSGTLTLAQAKYAITQGGYGTGIILGTRNPQTGILEIDPRTGNGVVRNDTNCSLPIVLVSYSIDNPNDPDFRMQTWYAASSPTVVPPHSTVTLHVNLPQCNFQADFFYGNSYPKPKGDRYQKHPNFLDAGYVVNRASAGGFSCNTQPPQEPPPNNSNPLSVSCPSIPRRVDLDERITRRVNISGGRAPYEIEWSGTDNLRGDDRTVTKRYTRPGTKYATVTVTDANNRTRSDECNTIVVEEEDEPYYNPPVYINHPPIVEYPYYPPVPPPPPIQPYIYMSELPYTGIEDYPLVPLFTGMFVFWAGIIGSSLIYRKHKVQKARF